MSRHEAPQPVNTETATQEEQDFVPLNFTPEQTHPSPTGELLVRAATKVNETMQRQNKWRHETIDESKNKVKRIGSRALKTVFRGLKTAAMVPVVVGAAGYALGEAGINQVKSAGNAASEFADRKVENTKDRLANNGDRARMFMGKFSAAKAGVELVFKNRNVENKTRAYEEAMAVARKRKADMEAAIAEAGSTKEKQTTAIEAGQAAEERKAERIRLARQRNNREHVASEDDAA